MKNKKKEKRVGFQTAIHEVGNQDMEIIACHNWRICGLNIPIIYLKDDSVDDEQLKVKFMDSPLEAPVTNLCVVYLNSIHPFCKILLKTDKRSKRMMLNTLSSQIYGLIKTLWDTDSEGMDMNNIVSSNLKQFIAQSITQSVPDAEMSGTDFTRFNHKTFI